MSRKQKGGSGKAYVVYHLPDAWSCQVCCVCNIALRTLVLAMAHRHGLPACD